MPAQATSTPTQAATAPPQATAATQATTAPAQSASQISGQAVNLELWHDDWGELYNKLMTKIGDDFTKENPRITVKWTFNAQNRDKLLTAYAAGTGPDIAEITVYGGQCAAFMDRGLFKALDDYWKTAGITPDKFIPSFAKICQYKGKILLEPGGADYQAVWYNKALLKAAGIEEPPKTWDEFAQQAVKLTKKDANGNIQQFGWAPGSLDLIVMSFGGSWMNEDNTQVTANSPENLRAAEWMANLAKQIDASKVRNFVSGQPGLYQGGNPFATGKQGFIFDGFWTYDALDKYAPRIDYVIVPQPTVSGKADETKNYPIEGWGWGVSSHGKNPDAAWQVTKYAMYDQAARMGAETLNWPTPLAAQAEFKDLLLKSISQNDRYVPYHHVFEEGYRSGTKFFPISVISPKYADEIARTSDAIILGKASPKEALDQLQKLMEDELAKSKS
jgi:multiple sugar transport system substrate-binding protein